MVFSPLRKEKCCVAPVCIPRFAIHHKRGIFDVGQRETLVQAVLERFCVAPVVIARFRRAAKFDARVPDRHNSV